MSNEMFPRLMPIDIKFFSGESPSPQKLTGIFKYLYSAFYVIESFLGNGIGYRADATQERNMIFNISNAIGAMGKLYKPSNRLISLKAIYRAYASVNSYQGVLMSDGITPDILHDQHAEHKLITEAYMHSFNDGEKSLIVKKAMNIPVDVFLQDKWVLGLECRGTGTVKIWLDNNNEIDIVIDEPASFTLSGSVVTRHKSRFIIDQYVSHLEILPSGSLEIFSFYLAKASEIHVTSEDQKPCNTGYALGMDNPTYYEVAKPCLHSYECNLATCSYCIGNTYDLYTREANPVNSVGKPVCGGDYLAGSTIAAQLVPAGGKKYEADTASTILTVQAPLLMIEKPYLIKFAPYAIHNLPSGETIPKNQVVIYDLQAGGGTANPVKYNMPIQTTSRNDIVYVNDLNFELSPSSTRIMAIGGTYGIANMMQDMMVALTEIEQRSVSVYAD